MISNQTLDLIRELVRTSNALDSDLVSLYVYYIRNESGAKYISQLAVLSVSELETAVIHGDTMTWQEGQEEDEYTEERSLDRVDTVAVEFEFFEDEQNPFDVTRVVSFIVDSSGSVQELGAVSINDLENSPALENVSLIPAEKTIQMTIDEFNALTGYKPDPESFPR